MEEVMMMKCLGEPIQQKRFIRGACMKGRSVVKLVLTMVFTVSVVWAFAGVGRAEDKALVLKFSNFWPAPHKNSVTAEQWARDVERVTKGKVKVNVYHGATLTPPNQTYDSVVNGICDVGMSALAYTRGKFPLSEVIDLPLGYKSGTQATGLINAFYKKFNPKEFDSVKVLFFHAHGPGILFTKKPVEKMEDVKGTKIRSTGLSAKMVQALGGAPVGMPMTESYDALSKGVADGILAPMEAMKGWKLGEVVKYTTENYGSAYSTGFFVVMNKQKWASLSPDSQKAIEKVNRTYAVKYGKVWDEIDREGREFMKARGNKFVRLSTQEDARWAQQVHPIINEYVKGTVAKGLPGDQALKFCQDYLNK
jgi:TRAP-type C4-dicarboxylate transport system substrate-binding protein